MELEYRKIGDYYIPNIISQKNIKNFKLGKYGRLRLNYLKNHKRALYMILLAENELQKHLMDIEENANQRLELLIKKFVVKENITEELKVKDQMEWVRKMNSIKNCAEEIILNELIYN
ncbi:MAG: TnpV protein [Clostridia bacterium]|nr:TnpV protein [Clostridia bacterium]